MDGNVIFKLKLIPGSDSTHACKIGIEDTKVKWHYISSIYFGIDDFGLDVCDDLVLRDEFECKKYCLIGSLFIAYQLRWKYNRINVCQIHSVW